MTMMNLFISIHPSFNCYSWRREPGIDGSMVGPGWAWTRHINSPSCSFVCACASSSSCYNGHNDISLRISNTYVCLRKPRGWSVLDSTHWLLASHCRHGEVTDKLTNAGIYSLRLVKRIAVFLGTSESRCMREPRVVIIGKRECGKWVRVYDCELSIILSRPLF